ncbi:MAG: cell wall hydrolase [Rhizobiaceae bacterium]
MRISDRLRPSLHGKAARLAYPLAVGLAVFVTYPSIIAYQDVAQLSSEPVQNRWLANMAQAPGQSLANISGGSTFVLAAASDDEPNPGIDPIITGTSKPAGETSPVRPEILEGVPGPKKPQKINRSQMGDRVLSSAPVSPPVRFSAGSVMERHSMFGPLKLDKRFELAFVKARPADDAYQVASLFHQKEDPLKKAIEADVPIVVASLIEESIPNILSYGAQEEVLRSPFAAVLDDTQPISLIPRLGKGDHQWAAEPLPLSTFSDREQNCLTAGIYFEARGEPVRGQAAVAQVILNRVKNPAYPDTICGVVYQNKEWRNRCQFSFACDRIKDRVNDSKRWEIAQYVARETTEGRIWLTEVGSSTHYHATYVKPKWASHMKKVGRIGLHIFYRTFGGGWS